MGRVILTAVFVLCASAWAENHSDKSSLGRTFADGPTFTNPFGSSTCAPVRAGTTTPGFVDAPALPPTPPKPTEPAKPDEPERPSKPTKPGEPPSRSADLCPASCPAKSEPVVCSGKVLVDDMYFEKGVFADSTCEAQIKLCKTVEDERFSTKDISAVEDFKCYPMHEKLPKGEGKCAAPQAEKGCTGTADVVVSFFYDGKECRPYLSGSSCVRGPFSSKNQCEIALRKGECK